MDDKRGMQRDDLDGPFEIFKIRTLIEEWALGCVKPTTRITLAIDTHATYDLISHLIIKDLK